MSSRKDRARELAERLQPSQEIRVEVAQGDGGQLLVIFGGVEAGRYYVGPTGAREPWDVYAARTRKWARVATDQLDDGDVARTSMRAALLQRRTTNITVGTVTDVGE